MKTSKLIEGARKDFVSDLEIFNEYKDILRETCLEFIGYVLDENGVIKLKDKTTIESVNIDGRFDELVFTFPNGERYDEETIDCNKLFEIGEELSHKV